MINKSLSFSNKVIQLLKEEIKENLFFLTDIPEVTKKLSFIRKSNEKVFIDNISDIMFVLSTIRNRNLITMEEQNMLKNTVVGFFGMSVGSHAVLTWMMESRANNVKIADPDIISASNLNRLPLGWKHIGRYKVDVIKKMISEINPSASIYTLKNTSIEEMKGLLVNKVPTEIIVDEIDDIRSKVFLRKYARQHKIPLISAADVGDNVVLDIERYDIEPQPRMFLGRLSNIEDLEIDHLTTAELKKMIINLVGLEGNSSRMLNSVSDISKKIKTWPQLGATATIAGGVVTTTIRKILLKENVQSGRYYISLDNILVKDFNSEDNKTKRQQQTALIQNLIGLDQ